LKTLLSKIETCRNETQTLTQTDVLGSKTLPYPCLWQNLPSRPAWSAPEEEEGFTFSHLALQTQKHDTVREFPLQFSILTRCSHLLRPLVCQTCPGRNQIAPFTRRALCWRWQILSEHNHTLSATPASDPCTPCQPFRDTPVFKGIQGTKTRHKSADSLDQNPPSPLLSSRS
jgi:hypothetical protein